MELGVLNLSVEDFTDEARRALKRGEIAATKALTPAATTILEIRRKLALQPAPPKLLAEALQQELHDHGVKAMNLLAEWEEEIGFESPIVLDLICNIMGKKAFLEKCRNGASAAAFTLRTTDPSEAHQERPRQEATARLFQLLEAIEAAMSMSQKCAAFTEPFREEFHLELSKVHNMLAIMRSELGEPDDGWHRPPSFQAFEQLPVLLAEARPPPPKPPEPEVPAMPPRGPNISIRMRLHGVNCEDATAKSEILLLERLADIIAKECGVPREWISDISFGSVVRQVTSHSLQDAG